MSVFFRIICPECRNETLETATYNSDAMLAKTSIYHRMKF
jgi:ribosomal protein S27E